VLDINLIATRRSDRQRRAKQMRLSVYALVGLVLLIGVMYAWLSVSIRLVGSQIGECQAQLRDPQLVAASREVRKLQAEITEMKPRLELLRRVHASETGWLAVLRDMSASVPGDLWLTGFTSKRDLMGHTLTLKGASLSHDSTADLMLNLKRTHWCGDPTLNFTQVNQSPGRTVVQFELAAPFSRAIGSETQ